MLRVKDSPKNVKWGRTREKCNHSVANPTKTTNRGMKNMEDIPGVNVDFTKNTFRDPAPGEIERGITQDPLPIPRAFQPPVFTAYSRNHRISQDSRNLNAQ
jgi:hypothetical protein